MENGFPRKVYTLLIGMNGRVPKTPKPIIEVKSRISNTYSRFTITDYVPKIAGGILVKSE